MIDKGEWKCLVENVFGKSVTICELNLKIPSDFEKPKFIEPVKINQMNNNENLVLECKVAGNPVPSLSWFKDDVLMNTGHDNILNLKKV